MIIRSYPLFDSYNKYGYINTTYIALANPGKRLLGVLNGVDESTCRLDINLNNTAVLTFDVNKMKDGKVSQFYHRIEYLMELEVPGVGWFKIYEPPSISGDGNSEVMSVRAESLEIELANYFIKGMEINMGTNSSLEMLATDNVYKALDGSDSLFSWSNMKFYRDTTELQEVINMVDDTWTKQDLIAILPSYPTLYRSWRVTYNTGTVVQAIENCANNMTDEKRAQTLRSYTIGKRKKNLEKQQVIYFLTQSYPELIEYLDVSDIDLTQTVISENPEEIASDQPETLPNLTIPEMLQKELQRQKELSMMDAVLEDSDWNVGFVDGSVLSESDDEDDLKPLPDKVGRFEISSSNIYNFLMQEASPYFRCIFVFDTINKLVNCYNVNNLGVDTNIVINFANIQNSVERSNEDPIKTVFHVNGGDELDIKYANLGEDTMVDLSYYMNTDHFDQSTIDKYYNWVEQREQLRQQYKTLAVDYYDKLDELSYIVDRVPVDGADPSQYKSFSDTELEEERKKYEAILRGLEQFYVDENNNFSIAAIEQSDDWNEYLYITTVILSKPLNALNLIYFDPVKEDYLIQTQEDNAHLGQIDIVLLNRQIQNGKFVEKTDDQVEREKKTSYKRQKEYLENYMYNFKTYGDSYGLNEIDVRITDLKNKIQSLWAKGYTIDPDSGKDSEDPNNQDEDPTNDTSTTTQDDSEEGSDEESGGTNQYDDDFHRRKYELYQKYDKALKEAEEVKAQREQEKADKLQELKSLSEQMQDLKDQGNMANEIYGFTEAELDLIKEYYVHTDYVNENMIITDIFTSQEIVDTEDELYKAAQEELYAVSHPQWKWVTSQSNLFLMPEFKSWQRQLDIGNYITIGMEKNPLTTEPEKYERNNINYLTKLRVISIGLNPFMIEPDIDITFSSIVQYKSKQNDFVDLFQLSTGVGDSQISAYSNSKHLDGSYSIDSSFLIKLLQGGMQTYIENSSADSMMESYQNVIGPISNVNDWIINTGASNDQIIKTWITEGDSGDTTVTGGNLLTTSILAKHLAINEIVSNNYKAPSDDSMFSTTGSYLNLLSGNFITPGFSVINTNTGTKDNPVWESNAYFAGTLNSPNGDIGGWKIMNECLYSESNGRTVMLQCIGSSRLVKNIDGSFTFIPNDNGNIEDKIAVITYDGDLYGYTINFSTTYPENDLITGGEATLYHTPEEEQQAQEEGIILEDKVYYTFESAEYGDDYALSFSISDHITDFKFSITMPSATPFGHYLIYMTAEKDGEQAELSVESMSGYIHEEEESIIDGFTGDTVFGVKNDDGNTVSVPFYVTNSGHLYASDADITGNINATSLTLGNNVEIPYSSISNTPTIPTNVTDLTGGANILYTDDVTVSTATTANGVTKRTITVGDQEFTEIESGDFVLTNIGLGDSTDDEETYLMIDKDGLLTANNAIIRGQIVATSGIIGGCSIDSNGDLKIKNINISGTLSGNILSGGTINGVTFNQVGGVDYRYVSADGEYAIGGEGMKSTTAISNGIMKADVVDTTNIISVDSTDNTIHSLSNFMVHGGITGTSGLDITGTATLRTVYLPTMWNTVAETDTPNLRVDSAGFMCRAPSSSIRYKNISDYMINNDIDRLYDVPVYWFKYKDGYIADTDQRYDKDIPGFIVEDWEDIMPIAIDHNDDGSPEMWNSNIVVPLMFQMIKNDHEQIQELKNKIKELEDKLSN